MKKEVTDKLTSEDIDAIKQVIAEQLGVTTDEVETVIIQSELHILLSLSDCLF